MKRPIRANSLTLLISFLCLLLVVAAFFLVRSQKSSLVAKTTDNSTSSPVLDKIIVPKPEIVATVSAKPNFERTYGSLTTQLGDNLLVLVNKYIKLPASYEPADLVSLEGKIANGAGKKMRKEAADALERLIIDSKQAGLNIIAVSAYRSYNEQEKTFNYWVSRFGLKEAERFSARAGHSQHQLGTAIDVSSPEISQDLTESFEKTKEGLWLMENAYKYGFVLSYPKDKEETTGYIYEPWHYRYIGPDNAKRMVELRLILEEYLRRFGVW